VSVSYTVCTAYIYVEKCNSTATFTLRLQTYCKERAAWRFMTTKCEGADI